MNFHDNFYDAAMVVRKLGGKAAENEYYGAIVRYYYEGEKPEFQTIAAEAGFAGVRWSLDTARAGREAGKKSGEARRKKAKTPDGECEQEQDTNQTGTNAEPNANQTGTNAEPNANQTGTKAEQVKVKVKVKEVKPNGFTTPKPPYREIVAYLNQKSGSNFKENTDKTRKLIEARFNDGFTLQDFFAVIDVKCEEWGDPGGGMDQYLRPETLFSNKFESYLNQAHRAAKAQGGKTKGGGFSAEDFAMYA